VVALTPRQGRTEAVNTGTGPKFFLDGITATGASHRSFCRLALFRQHDFMSRRKGSLEETLAGHLERRSARSQLRRLTIVPPHAVDFSSNSYLSLSTNADVQRDFVARLKAHADAASTPAPDRKNAPLLGSGGSRLLDGNSTLAEELEREIAAFHGAEAGLLFNSAFDANVGLFACVPQSGDVVVYDELIHASVHDGMRLSRAGRRVGFAHNSVWQDVKGSASSMTGASCLESVLACLVSGAAGQDFFDGKKNVFIAVEGLYSMDGDLAPLKDIVECVEKCLPAGNGYIVVDEAHSTGIYGDCGRGLVCQLGLEDRVWARVHGFGKAMSCTGGRFLPVRLRVQSLLNGTNSALLLKVLYSPPGRLAIISSTMPAASSTPRQ
jgi:8-amino-7-oxononanoate synthase